MTEFGVVLIAGGLLLLTIVVVVVAPLRGPLVLGLVAVAVAAGCFVVAYRVDYSRGIEEGVKFAIVGLLGVAHLVTGSVLLGVSVYNRRRRSRDA